MSSPKVWWRPPGAEEIYTMEASDSGTSCFRFVPFKLNGDFPSIEWRGHVVGSDYPKHGTVSAEGIFEEQSTSRDEHKRAVEGALQQIESKKLEKVVVSRVKSVIIEGTPENAFRLKCDLVSEPLPENVAWKS